MDPIDGGEQKDYTKRAILESLAAGQDVSVYTMDQVEELGAALNRPYQPFS